MLKHGSSLRVGQFDPWVEGRRRVFSRVVPQAVEPSRFGGAAEAASSLTSKNQRAFVCVLRCLFGVSLGHSHADQDEDPYASILAEIVLQNSNPLCLFAFRRFCLHRSLRSCTIPKLRCSADRVSGNILKPLKTQFTITIECLMFENLARSATALS